MQTAAAGGPHPPSSLAAGAPNPEEIALDADEAAGGEDTDFVDDDGDDPSGPVDPALAAVFAGATAAGAAAAAAASNPEEIALDDE